jgi:hypothetical protein
MQRLGFDEIFIGCMRCFREVETGRYFESVFRAAGKVNPGDNCFSSVSGWWGGVDSWGGFWVWAISGEFRFWFGDAEWRCGVEMRSGDAEWS